MLLLLAGVETDMNELRRGSGDAVTFHRLHHRDGGILFSASLDKVVGLREVELQQ